jgi:hypothetical protein
MKRFASLFVTLSATVSVVRVLVLFFESYSRVSADRFSDAKLLDLCRAEESAAASRKFQEACVAARSDSAAPILLKSLLHACNTVMFDTAELFNSPTRIAIMLLFMISGASAPFVRFLFTTLVAGLRTRQETEEDEEEEEGSRATLVCIDPRQTAEPNAWSRVKRGVQYKLMQKLLGEKEHCD